MTAPLEQALQCAAETASTVTAQSEQRFNDVPTDHYAYEAIEWMVANGITGGCGDGNFCPDRPLTRAHLAAFLYRANTSMFSGQGDAVTDEVELEPGYHTVRVTFLPAPGYDWDDGRDHEFYAWFGSKKGGTRLVSGEWEGESATKNTDAWGFSHFRVDAGDEDGHWFTIEADDRFVWWAEVHRNSTPDDVTFG